MSMSWPTCEPTVGPGAGFSGHGCLTRGAARCAEEVSLLPLDRRELPVERDGDQPGCDRHPGTRNRCRARTGTERDGNPVGTPPENRTGRVEALEEDERGPIEQDVRDRPS